MIIIEDIELNQITAEIHENYMMALDFINTNPDYSLLKFRNIAECIVNLIAQKNNLVFENDRLIDKINYLFECQLILKTCKQNYMR